MSNLGADKTGCDSDHCCQTRSRSAQSRQACVALSEAHSVHLSWSSLQHRNCVLARMRFVFVNTECCIQINPADNPDRSGPHWYCDAVAADFRSKTVFL